MKKLTAFLFIFSFGMTPVTAQEPVSFKSKIITMIIGFPPAGGADITGRALAASMEKYLPGNPKIAVKNVVGADGMTAMNFVAQQAERDGLTFSVSANTTVDPLNYRRADVHYKATEFEIIGGNSRGGEVLIVNRDAEKRLYDKNATPVVMASLGGVPRSGMQMTAWGIEMLGWNARWVTGYRGTNEIALALERSEADMTATGTFATIEKLLATGKFTIIMQSGMLKDGKLEGRPEFGDAPVLSHLLESKITEPNAKLAFAYWRAMATTDKWFALPPKTPKPIVDVYRQAFAKVSQDAEFLDRVRKIAEDFVLIDHKAVADLINTLDKVSPEATFYMTATLRKQGLDKM